MLRDWLIGAAVLWLGSCGDNLAPNRVTPDQRDSGVAVCNPLTQQGCLAGEKCGIITFGPTENLVTCLPNGQTPPGGVCSTAFEEDTFDDCRSDPGQGYACGGGVCSEVCDPRGDECGDGRCTEFRVDGLPIGIRVGICLPPCHPLTDDCGGQDYACYIQAQTGRGVCGPEPPDAKDLGQDDACFGPDGGGCFLNGCRRGYQPLAPLAPGGSGSRICTKFCTPTRTDVDHPDHPEGIEDPDTGKRSCASPATSDRPGPDSAPNNRYQCRFLNSFYNDTAGVPDDIGFCVDKEIWGACELFDAEACFSGSDPSACEPPVPGCLSVADIFAIQSGSGM